MQIVSFTLQKDKHMPELSVYHFSNAVSKQLPYRCLGFCMGMRFTGTSSPLAYGVGSAARGFSFLTIQERN